MQNSLKLIPWIYGQLMIIPMILLWWRIPHNNFGIFARQYFPRFEKANVRKDESIAWFSSFQLHSLYLSKSLNFLTFLVNWNKHNAFWNWKWSASLFRTADSSLKSFSKDLSGSDFLKVNFISLNTINSRFADTSLLRTPRYYGQQLNPRRKLQKFDWNKLPLLRTYGHFIRSQRHNFIVFSLAIADTEQHLGIFAHKSSPFFCAFWDCLCLFWSVSASSVHQLKFLHLFLRRPSLQSRCHEYNFVQSVKIFPSFRRKSYKWLEFPVLSQLLDWSVFHRFLLLPC